MPWGVSEAAYNSRDLYGGFRYKAFGIPELALNPKLSPDVVIAPYASVLALTIDPHAATRNLRVQAAKGWIGRYGCYESVDCTPGREGIVRAFMAHHQGMSLLALDNALHQDCMQSRFHSEPIVQATELLLQERIPAGAMSAKPAAPAGRLVVPEWNEPAGLGTKA